MNQPILLVRTTSSSLLKVSLFLLFSLFLNIGHSQSAEDWKLESEQNGVKLYSATVTCDGQNLLVMKVQNTKPAEKHVNFTVVIESPQRNRPLRPQVVSLKPMETKAGSCGEKGDLTADLKDIKNYKLSVTMRVN